MSLTLHQTIRVEQLIRKGNSTGAILAATGYDLLDILPIVESEGAASRAKRAEQARQTRLKNLRRYVVQAKRAGMTRKGIERHYGISADEAKWLLHNPRKPKKSNLTLAAEEALRCGFDRETVIANFGDSALPG